MSSHAERAPINLPVFKEYQDFLHVQGRFANGEGLRSFIAEVCEDSRQFATGYRYHFDDTEGQQQIDVMNSWCSSDQGKKTIFDLTKETLRIISLCSKYSDNLLGGHDIHHFMQDVIGAMKITDSENIHDYRELVLITSLLHDIGRSPEALIRRNKKLGNELGEEVRKNHAAISFYFARHLFKFFPIQPAIKNRMLHAILNHTGSPSGVSDENFSLDDISNLTVSADRSDLTGADLILRVISHEGGELGYLLSALSAKLNSTRVHSFGENDGKTSIFEIIEFCIRNLRPIYGETGERMAHDGKVIAGTFLYLGVPEKVRKVIFAPEIARDQGRKLAVMPSKKILPENIWQEILRESKKSENKLITTDRGKIELAVLLRGLIGKPGMTLTDEMLDQLYNKLLVLTPEERSAFTRGLRYIRAVQIEQTATNKFFLKMIINKYPADSIQHLVATQAINELEYIL